MALSSNLEFFLDSFGQNYPEEQHGTLDCISIALTCAFNRQGTLLAVGCNDGRICIWDFTTRCIAKIITGHVHPVCSLSWSRNGQRIASCSTDSKVCIWDTLSGEPVWQYNFSTPIMKVQCHPRNMDEYVVVPFKQLALVVKLGRPGFTRLPTEDGADDYHTYATYSRRGDYIITGNPKGHVMVLDSVTMQVRASFRIMTAAATATAIRTIEVSRRLENMVVNTADRIIRVYRLSDIICAGQGGDPEPYQRLQDLINKNAWKKAFFSGDGEYVCAGSVRYALHIWENYTGTLVKILHGTKGETLMDAAWHPVRPIIVSVSGGIVSIWSQTHIENWSAFTPDFRELDENVEYEERESEFDLEDEDRSVKEEEEIRDENDYVDVVTVEKNTAYCSSDEEEEDPGAVLYIPITPEIEDPEDVAWMMEMYPEYIPPMMPAPPASPPKAAEPKRPRSRKDSQTGYPPKRPKMDSPASADSGRSRSDSQS
ncbi:retinoblastoma-binding protein 5 homolog [Paramacrobiotus metropolitanus]|uniref:retinoblastoma-binding protein 5 homolog n=1 Tax=Paramacrobiotus metropolitanus TaxID=2943436 RepID=UPI002445C151|nr:retinoblastoma-binding protein 5 homolog [Paramacrobiotus metropolitanus]